MKSLELKKTYVIFSFKLLRLHKKTINLVLGKFNTIIDKMNCILGHDKLLKSSIGYVFMVTIHFQ